jgi:murein DD-endopeptidase MepM/ murein hydrolase activator NlpD
MPQHPAVRFRKIATAVAATLAMAAVTAFGVAPLRESQPPSAGLLVESLVSAPEVLSAPDRFVQTERILRGETVASLLDRLGAADAELLEFVAADPTARLLLSLVPGRTVTAEIDSSGRVLQLQYRHGDLLVAGQETSSRLTIRREPDGFEALEQQVPVDRQRLMAAVVIEGSLFAATDAAGIPESVATQVADILDAEIDLGRDLRRGADLRLVYETVREADGLEPAVGHRVIAVQLINGERMHGAIWFNRMPDSLEGEYFGFDGRVLRKDFLRNPIELSRVRSGFARSRMHPIDGEFRAHKGIDFAAPSGTPVRVTGAGVVESAAWENGYGRVIRVRHRDQITTLYAHLRGFAPGIAKGKRVKQGDVIGYVGMTGWATGPHLHYEFMVKGRHVDPFRVASYNAVPLDSAERERFSRRAQLLSLQLSQLAPLRLVARFE